MNYNIECGYIHNNLIHKKTTKNNDDFITQYMNIFYNTLYNDTNTQQLNYKNNNFNFIKKNKRLHIHNNNNDNDKLTTNTHNDDQCGAVLFDKSGNFVLLIKQRLSNKWGIPKGHMNKRELLYDNKLECVKREIHEETGINLNKIKYECTESEYINNKLFYIIQIYKYKEHINLNPFDLNEISDYEWVSIYDLYNFCKINSCNKTLRDMVYSNTIKQKLFKQHYKV